MKAKQLITIFVILACLNVFGQQAKKESMLNKDTQQEIIQNLQSQIDSQQVIILQLQEENLAIKSDLQDLAKIISDYQYEIKYYSEKNHTEISHWFSWLALIVTFVSIACPVIVNLSYKKYYFDQQKQNLQKDIDNMKESLESAKNDATSAKNSLSKISELKNDFDAIKNSIESVKKEIDDSKRDAEDAAKRAKLSEQVREQFTKAYYEKDQSKAIELYNHIIELNPMHSYAYNNRGVFKMKAGDYFGALDDFNNAIKYDSKNWNAYNNRAYLYLKKGKIKDAFEDIKIAMDNDSENYHYYETRGEIYMAIEEYIKAESDFTQAIRINKKDKESYENRAKCYRKLAEKEQDTTKKADLITKAEADEEKAKSLGDEE